MKLCLKIEICLLICALPPAANAEMLRTVALTGTQAPGTPDGVYFNAPLAGPNLGSTTLRGPVLNSAGQVAFTAGLFDSRNGNTIGGGIWADRSGSLSLVVRNGDPAPGFPSGVNFTGAGSIALNSVGRIAFRAGITGIGVDSSNDLGVWSEGSGSLELVAREGDHAPGTPSEILFDGFRHPVINSAGQTAFVASLRSSTIAIRIDQLNNQGIWSEGSGSFQYVARESDPAPGLPSGVNISTFFSADPVINAAGQLAYVTRLTGGSGILLDDSGTTAVVARSGDLAPGFSHEVRFDQFASTVSINSAGQLAFIASLRGSGIDSTNDSSIWSDGSGTRALVARTGDQAPGLSTGVKFTGFQGSVVLNSAGQTAFFGSVPGHRVNGNSDGGIWSEGSGTLELVALSGNHAPGTPRGVNFRSLNTQGSVLQLNSHGQTAFMGLLEGNDVDETNNRGIWAEDRSGRLRLIARTGDLLEVAPSDFRTIGHLSVLGITGNQDGRDSSFNDLGQLAFRAILTDGTEGIFVSNVATIPEPTSPVLLCLASSLFFSRRLRVKNRT